MHKNKSSLVSITSQGQLTIPKFIRKSFGIERGAKAVVRKEGDRIVVVPKKDFWSLSGALRAGFSLSDADLKKARKAFGRKWPRK